MGAVDRNDDDGDGDGDGDSDEMCFCCGSKSGDGCVEKNVRSISMDKEIKGIILI